MNQIHKKIEGSTLVYMGGYFSYLKTTSIRLGLRNDTICGKKMS